jgi:hypothetical protein
MTKTRIALNSQISHARRVETFRSQNCNVSGNNKTPYADALKTSTLNFGDETTNPAKHNIIAQENPPGTNGINELAASVH